MENQNPIPCQGQRTEVEGHSLDQGFEIAGTGGGNPYYLLAVLFITHRTSAVDCEKRTCLLHASVNAIKKVHSVDNVGILIVR